jgi:2-polyprenyl-3-methyl-5-hydroxy-6-metoxy-1,4-benzoquinol methylase
MNATDLDLIDDAELRNISADGHPERILPSDLSSGLGGEHLARYTFAAHWVPSQRVADICCGVGYGSNLLAASGAKQVHGIDISAAAIEYAERRYAGPTLEFLCADAMVSLPIPEVDVVVCFEGIEHVTRPDALLANLTRRLKPGGVAIISTPNGAEHDDGHSGNAYHTHEYQLAEFERLLSRFFGQVKMYFQWGLNDPYDFRWTPINILKALLPVSFKHALRSRLHSDSSQASTDRSLGIAVRHRPYPINYLALPGLCFASPRIWLAVCEQPRQSGSARLIHEGLHEGNL